jgi:hypothetical protein
MKPIALLLILSLAGYSAISQNLPYEEIPDYPEEYHAGAVLSRMTDGLGYRFYWATEGLRNEDLNYVPSEGARSTFKTMEHIFSLVRMIHNTLNGEANISPEDPAAMEYEELRAATLELIHACAEKMGENSDFSSLPIMFKMGEQEASLPFWNIINGPLSDAIYHTGQIVSFRRASGNPIDPRVNVFTGKNADR